MFIDIHAHATRKPMACTGTLLGLKTTPDILIKRYDAAEIEQAVVLPIVSPESTHGVQAMEDVLEMAESYPGRFIPFCNIDPRAMEHSVNAPLGDYLRYYKDRGCKGLGEVTANLPFTHPMVQNLFHHCQEVGFPLTFHISCSQGYRYGLVDDPGLPQLELSLQTFYDLKFFGHSQSFWAEIGQLETVGDRVGYPEYPIKEEGAVPRLMRKYPNLYGDLSAGSGCNALTRDPDYAVTFLNEFQDRLLFGTDITAPDTPFPLVDFLLELRGAKRISEGVFQKVARENAIKILGLES
jgi:hypothetical protein